MNFNPVLNNIGPSLIQHGYDRAAEIQIAEAAAKAQGITQLGQSARQLGIAVAEWQANSAKMKQNASEIDAWGHSGVLRENP